MRPFLGARELGLQTEWRFGFINPGQTVEPTHGVLYLDVGSCLKEGIVDHHSEINANTCTSDLVFRKRELVYNHLMREWLQLHDAGKIPEGHSWTPVLVTHEDPDWDGVVASYLVMTLIEHGDFPPWAAALVRYSLDVDQGRYAVHFDKTESIYAPHIAYLAVQNLEGPGNRNLSSTEKINRGHEIIRRVIASLEKAKDAGGEPPNIRPADFIPGNCGGADWIRDSWFDDIRNLLDADLAKFNSDFKLRTTLEGVDLPAVDGIGAVQVPAFIASGPMQSHLNKYWVRAKGYPYFICPYRDEKDPGNADPGAQTVYPKVILSLDPNFSVNGRRPTLRGLGYALEREETKVRQEGNNGVDDRGGSPRFLGGYCGNEDPWYDGRAFDWTIVDSPWSKTRIPYDKIVEIATKHRFWEIPLLHGSISLVFANQSDLPDALQFNPLRKFEGMAETLEALYAGSSEADCPPQTGGNQWIDVKCTIRRFPQGTCKPFRVVQLRAKRGAAFEQLLEFRDTLIRSMGNMLPSYMIAKVMADTHFAGPARFDRLLNLLGGGNVIPLAGSSDSGEIVLFNSRCVVIGNAPLESSTNRTDPALELLLYLAFLNETLISFSEKISAAIPVAGESLEKIETEEVRRNFLRFQTRYYQVEVSRAPRERRLLEEMVTALKLPEHYAEVQSELDRLEQLETEIADKRKERAEKIMQIALYFIAVFSVCQLIPAFYGMDSAKLKTPSMWYLTAFTILASVAIVAWIERRRHK